MSGTLSILPPFLIAGSAAIIILLGLIHLLYTFAGPKLFPRDRELQVRMQEVSLVITPQTTMWRAWVGFNASHSLGAILFGAVYGYLSLAHSAFLFQSTFLLSLGLVFLLGYTFLSKRYWFSVPFRSILAATALYVFATLIALA